MRNKNINNLSLKLEKLEEPIHAMSWGRSSTNNDIALSNVRLLDFPHVFSFLLHLVTSSLCVAHQLLLLSLWLLVPFFIFLSLSVSSSLHLSECLLIYPCYGWPACFKKKFIAYITWFLWWRSWCVGAPGTWKTNFSWQWMEYFLV